MDTGDRVVVVSANHTPRHYFPVGTRCTVIAGRTVIGSVLVTCDQAVASTHPDYARWPAGTDQYIHPADLRLDAKDAKVVCSSCGVELEPVDGTWVNDLPCNNAAEHTPEVA